MYRVILSCGWALIAALTAVASESTVVAEKPPAQRARNAIDRWNQMSPEERERELAKLPPERAQQIRERIRRYNQLPPWEKQALRERYQKFAQLPPEKQEIVRRSVRAFRDLPVDRRRLVREEIGRLRALPEGQRNARLSSAEFRSQFSPPERQLIRDITAYFPGQLK